MSLFTRSSPSPDTDATDETSKRSTAHASASDDPAAGAPARTGAPVRRWLRHRTAFQDKYPLAARGLSWGVTALAAALVYFALLMPGKAEFFEVRQFLRIPVEPILGAALLMVLPRRPRLVAAVGIGVGLAALVVVKALDIGFNQFLGRGFNVVLDWGLLDDAESYVKDTLGSTGARAAVIGLAALVLLLFVVMALAVVRLVNLLARERDRATRGTIIAGAVWITCAALGLTPIENTAVASRSTIGFVQDRWARVQETLRDEAAFAEEAKRDRFADVPGDRLLTGLRGKDVMITFIESYGRAALEDPAVAPGVNGALDEEGEALTRAGFAAKSGWLTSATYGGSSWLGHSTFLTGLWIDNQSRYRTVTAGERLTLPGAFHKSGAWRTVGIVPGVQKNWPEGDFYGLDKVYDSRDLGYQGPKFSWSTMPDQYALTAFERLEAAKKGDKPLMSEIILTSSHQPWAPLPEMVGWDEVGDGSVYKGIEKAGKDPADVFTDPVKVKEEYGRSVQYSLHSLLQYVEKYGDENTVLVFLGDHQPMASVSGNGAGHDVPVTVVAHDPKILDRIDDWGWSDGLRPGDDAPVWRMDSFRDRFLTAYGEEPHVAGSPSP
ncbi:sulfatase-like hydrolase/transferase [Streptomyces europaeiscabiei]|uniref:sulfatase-like hydrolase/transferase n=1 Tax=Streptomyces europaeiscabiei TaxID=146819 RepID=UPI0029A37048|nr:sulfatase-like hydrolase/transferase [Streptomyces europaeiscabiei]MDX3589387.1 sulfatase [Streptomyces europaeiscabiei]MDX3635586.1 sulfatase [Streptomyces europaeiscabiei]MDX3653817.1 sulfatase [Streptomyces europaeiscabiei]WUD30632.1 sulfatase [Streptomyces europaeiscabiei]